MPFIVADEIEAYASAHTTPPPPWLQEVAAETAASLPAPEMLTGPLEGRFLEMLVFALRARLVLEIGTFSGYGALSMAAGLPPGGRVITCDLDPRALEVARRHIAASPFADRVEVREGPAMETIASLEGAFDFVFIDADKTGYVAYYEAVLPKLSAGGLIAVDNVLWRGQVLDLDDTSDDTAALRAFNERVAGDPRVTCVMTTVRDGVTLIRRA
ncbi:MAG: class I SAM-dependent methyltransferase [Actinomycetota bacterium]|nr:class I SAM-dependent methyltransferase [Actinomycetota bacterium]